MEERGKGVVVLKVRFEGVAMVKGEEDGGERVMNGIDNGVWIWNIEHRIWDMVVTMLMLCFCSC